jgi:hypothetical protein
MELWNPTLPPANTIRSLKLTKEWREKPENIKVWRL